MYKYVFVNIHLLSKLNKYIFIREYLVHLINIHNSLPCWRIKQGEENWKQT